MACVLGVLQVAALHALLILGFALLIAPGEAVAVDVTPAEWLRRQSPPVLRTVKCALNTRLFPGS